MRPEGSDVSPERPAGDSHRHPAISHHPRPKERGVSGTAEEEPKQKGKHRNHPNTPRRDIDILGAITILHPMSAEYRFHGKLTFEEYLECHRIFAAKRRIILRSLAILGGIIFLIRGAKADPPDSSRIAIAITAIAYGTVISPLQFRYRVRRLWRQNPSIQKGMNITVTEDGLRVIDDKGQPFHKDWSSFLKFRESPSLFLLYLSPISPLCLPKGLISQDDLPAVRNLLSSVLPSIGTRVKGEGNQQSPPPQPLTDKEKLLRAHDAASQRMVSHKSLVMEPEFIEAALRDQGLTAGQAAPLAQHLLDTSAEHLAPHETEAFLIFATDLTHSREGVGILNRLLLLKNHMKHEDIAQALQSAADPTSVPFLAEAITLDLDYLSWDENKALPRKCFWALAAIGTPEAWQTITLHSTSGDPIIVQWADEQLQRRQSSGM